MLLYQLPVRANFFRAFLTCTLIAVFSSNMYGQSGISDCTGAIEVCGNGAISSNATGAGIQEIDGTHSCSSQENNSLWIKIEITRSGTLGFTLTPQNEDILVDYDFVIYGPTSSCDDLGYAVRCSTTNPNQAGLPNNLTGMKDTETDIAEGPGPDGNGFVKSLDVLPGETYYILIDRPIGESPFDLEWTGTSTVDGSPFPEGVEVNQPQDLVQCGINGVAEFDVFQTRPEINDQSQTTIEYYSSLGNAVDQTYEIQGNYISTLARKKIYARVENDLTGCYEIVEFNLIIPPGPAIKEEVAYELCDIDSDGVETFDLASLESEILQDIAPESVLITYHKTIAGAQNNQNGLSLPFRSSGESIFARVEEITDTGCYSIAEIDLRINTPVALPDIPLGGINIASGSFSFTLPNRENYEFAVNNIRGPYQENSFFSELSAGKNVLYVRGKENCEVGSVELIIPVYGEFFTPNGDSHNDSWRIDMGGMQSEDDRVQIFNRYGKLLAEFNWNSRGWDGTFNGRELPSDDYWFSFIHPRGQIIKGHFSLIR